MGCVLLLAACGGGGSAPEPTQQVPSMEVTSIPVTTLVEAEVAAAAAAAPVVSAEPEAPATVPVQFATNDGAMGATTGTASAADSAAVVAVSVDSPGESGNTASPAGGAIALPEAVAAATLPTSSAAASAVISTAAVPDTSAATTSPAASPSAVGTAGADAASTTADSSAGTAAAAGFEQPQAVVLPALPAAALAYYVDAASGNDGNAGTQAAPWRSLARLTALRAQAGQAVYLRCGSTWRESVSLSNTQLGSNAILAGYGNCASNPARILGADDFSGGWTHANGIWSRALPAGTPKITQVFVNGVRHRVAQWPNHGGLGAEFAKLGPATVPSKGLVLLSPADLASLAARNLVGASISVRSEPWHIELRKVATWNPGSGSIGLDTATKYTMEAGNGFVLSDQPWMLDAAGEFFHDVAANRLYLIASDRLVQADLNKALVEGSVRDQALLLRGLPGVMVQNLAVGMARSFGMVVDDTLGASISGLRVLQRVAPAAGLPGATIAASSFTDNLHLGLDANASQAVTLRDSVLRDTGTQGAVVGPLAAVFVGPAGQVLNNRIAGAGYHGIYFNGDKGTRVSGNHITGYCQRLTDCAAIYTWNGTGASATATSRTSVVEGNRIGAASPAVDGAMGPGRDALAGIFLDDKTSGVTVRGNWLAGMPIGIGLHNSFNNKVENNDIVLTTRASIGMGMDIVDGSGTDYLRGNVITGNRLLPARAASGTFPGLPAFNSSVAVDVLHRVLGQAAITSRSLSFIGNQISLMHGASLPVASVTGTGATAQLRLSQWRALAPNDAAMPGGLRFALLQSDTGPEMLANGGFDAGSDGWGVSLFTGSTGSAQLSSGVAGCNGSCMTFTSSSVQDSLIDKAFTVTPGLPHLVSFTAVFGAAGKVASPYIFKASSPWGNAIDTSGFRSWTASDGLAGDVQDYMAIFVPTLADPVRMALKVATPGAPVSFDNVSVRRLLGYALSRTAEYAAVVHAEGDAATVVSCSALGWPAGCSAVQLDGTAVAMPLTVPAGTSALLLRADSPWRR